MLTGQALGRDFTLDELQEQGYQAVFLAIGRTQPASLAASRGRRTRTPGCTARHRFPARRQRGPRRQARRQGGGHRRRQRGHGRGRAPGALGASEVDDRLPRARDGRCRPTPRRSTRPWRRASRSNPCLGPVRRSLGTDGRVDRRELQSGCACGVRRRRPASPRVRSGRRIHVLDGRHVILAIGQAVGPRLPRPRQPAWDRRQRSSRSTADACRRTAAGSSPAATWLRAGLGGRGRRAGPRGRRVHRPLPARARIWRAGRERPSELAASIARGLVPASREAGRRDAASRRRDAARRLRRGRARAHRGSRPWPRPSAA